MTRRLSFWLSVAATAVAWRRPRGLREPGAVAAGAVPTHWNIHNQVDQTTPRDHVLPVLLLLPGVMAGMTLLAMALPWLSPKTVLGGQLPRHV